MRNPLSTMRLLALSVCTVLLCSACGYRSSLYYPSDTPPTPQPPVIAPTQ
ncbi:hypothetical protein [Formosimonas limnophila]|nr:hypothetical protein [Formosimonas limnophila]